MSNMTVDTTDHNISRSPLESDSKGECEIFMVGQGELPANQTKKEIARAVEAEIARVERLARNADKAAEKRHTSPRDQHDGSRDSNDKVGDGAASGGTTLSSIDVA
jgi:hypothetical protein